MPAGTSFVFDDLPSTWNGFIYVLSGEVRAFSRVPVSERTLNDASAQSLQGTFGSAETVAKKGKVLMLPPVPSKDGKEGGKSEGKASAAVGNTQVTVKPARTRRCISCFTRASLCGSPSCK